MASLQFTMPAFQKHLCHAHKNAVHGALCSVAIDKTDSPLPEWVQLMPAGKVDAADGRKFLNDTPDDVVKAFAGDTVQLPIDYEHATEIKGPNGDPAPAAGWITELQNRDGALWAKVEWNDVGAQSLRSRAYRYISPAFLVDKVGRVIRMLSAGLTNRPALHQLPALAAEWSGAFVNDLPDSAFLYVESGGEKDDQGKTVPRSLRHFPYKGADGQVDMPHLRNALSRLPQSNLPQSKIEELTRKAQSILEQQTNAGGETTREEKIMEPEMLKLLGLAEGATKEQATAAVKALVESKNKVDADLKSATARAESPSLDKFVPRADYDAVMTRAATAEKKVEDQAAQALKNEADAVIADALKAKKITPATKDFYLSTCTTREGLDKFKAFCTSQAPVIVDDKDNLDKKPEGTGTHTATELELEVARNCGFEDEAAKKIFAAA